MRQNIALPASRDRDSSGTEQKRLAGMPCGLLLPSLRLGLGEAKGKRRFCEGIADSPAPCKNRRL